jgi:hypothetical protein
MMNNNDFVIRARRHATHWKSTTMTLPEAARGPAAYLRDGKPQGMYPFCLPAAYASHNLLPDVRDAALAEFVRAAITWHAQTPLGPTNHLLSSQIQCVNTLEPLANNAELMIATFEGVLDIVQPLEIEPGCLVAYEFIGSGDHLHEAVAGHRSRGAHCTSVDAAIRYRNGDGAIELALIEWKYVEDYRGHELSRDKRGIREPRYVDLWNAPDGPLRADLIPYADMFVEPFYQLMRQQLLAHELEKSHECGADVVRVVHVAPRANTALRASLNRPSHLTVGDDVFAVWQELLRRPDRFVSVDSTRLWSSASAELRARYDHV